MLYTMHDTYMIQLDISLNLPMIWFLPQRWFYEDVFTAYEMPMWCYFSLQKKSTINWTTIVGFPRLFFTARGSARLLVESVSGSVLAQIKVVEVCFSFSAGHLLNVEGLSLCWFRVIGHYCFRVFLWLYWKSVSTSDFESMHPFWAHGDPHVVSEFGLNRPLFLPLYRTAELSQCTFRQTAAVRWKSFRICRFASFEFLQDQHVCSCTQYVVLVAKHGIPTLTVDWCFRGWVVMVTWCSSNGSGRLPWIWTVSDRLGHWSL